MSITIRHDPACGTQRNMLALVRATGTEPQLINCPSVLDRTLPADFTEEAGEVVPANG
ncbi:MAG: hypothetical protein LOX97_11465 [Sphingomonas sp.]|nr:hypothetical protein [Sphingomonas sp.]